MAFGERLKSAAKSIGGLLREQWLGPVPAAPASAAPAPAVEAPPKAALPLAVPSPPPPKDHPRPAARLIDAMLAEWKRVYIPYTRVNIAAFNTVAAEMGILGAEPDLRLALGLECAERLSRRSPSWPPWELSLIMNALLAETESPGEEWLCRIIPRLATPPRLTHYGNPYIIPLVRILEEHVCRCGMTLRLRELVALLIGKIFDPNNEDRKLAERLRRLLGDDPTGILLAGEPWSERAIADLAAAPPEVKAAWVRLFEYCRTAQASAPTAKWIKAAESLIDPLGWPNVRDRLLVWFPLVDRPRTDVIPDVRMLPDPNLMITETHVEILKGLAWACGTREDAEIARALGGLALTAYRKIPSFGPRAAKLGHACVHALGAMPGMTAVGQLAILKSRVKFLPAQKGIEKAFLASAGRAGMSRDEVEELGTPSLGFEQGGTRHEPLGEITAELTVTDSTTVALRWLKADGKELKTVPAAVKTEFAAEITELRAAQKDAARILTALRERLDGLYLNERTWPLDDWRERYLDHPLAGPLARRLIWTWQSGDSTGSFIWLDGNLVGPDDAPAILPAKDATIRLWHPLGAPLAEIKAWRVWLERHEVRQPFKQAHREIYLLTDAERITHTYSNRFAAHILRQGQISALCSQRGWRHSLRLHNVDSDIVPTRRNLPQWNLHAEFWVDAPEDADGNAETTDAGVHLYLTTDQVRFYREGEPEPLPLESIPPLVFSEIMRDVDLFVGVTSVGNDPNWLDGGEHPQFATYWSGYAFGDLSATARTRREILEGLVPRLRIAARCTFEDRFLVVRGDLRTYRIHLGSGNIMMEPDNAYLCIVRGQTKETGEQGRLFLPFEGDSTLSLILSKAFMLAADKEIKDPTITRQIK